MPKKPWISVVEALDRFGGHDKATMLRLFTELAKGNIESRCYMDMPIGSGRPTPELPAGVLAVPVVAIRIGIPPETWGLGGNPSGVCIVPLIIDGQRVGHMAHFRGAPFYRVELLRSDVEALVDPRSSGGRPQTEARERLVNWLSFSLSPAECQPKHGRPGILWRRYEKLCREDNREPGLSRSHGEQLIRDFLEDPTRFADSSQSEAVDSPQSEAAENDE